MKLITMGDDTYEVDILSFRPGDPGNSQGPPENCWPAEPDDVEFEAWLEDVRVTNEETLKCLEDYVLEVAREEWEEDHQCSY